jgi:hypothetical protein
MTIPPQVKNMLDIACALAAIERASTDSDAKKIASDTLDRVAMFDPFRQLVEQARKSVATL